MIMHTVDGQAAMTVEQAETLAVEMRRVTTPQGVLTKNGVGRVALADDMAIDGYGGEYRTSALIADGWTLQQ